MKTIREPSQQRLFDPFEGVIGKTGRKHIQNGWQSLFRDVLLEQMPVKWIGKDLCDDQGRPTFELHAIIGLLLIREFHGWTVPQTHEAILFRADIQYALNLEPGVEVTQRTIERYLRRMQNDEEISEELFTQVTDTLLHALEVKVRKQRLDSTHILSDMANMGRARMIGVALKRFFLQVQKHDATGLAGLPEELLARYRKPVDSQIFGDLHKTEARQLALQQAAEDLATVLEAFAAIEPFCRWSQYEQLRTIFAQQCEIREEFVQVRQRTGGRVIQNVSDPDATFCGKKGPGYQAQICETHNDQGDPNFITAARVETAIDSDADAVEPVLEDLKERDLLPEEMLADTGYGGHQNVELAEDEGVKLIAPVPGGKKFDAEEVGYDRFELDENNRVVNCPAGHAPESTSYVKNTGKVWARMDAKLCAACPLLPHCKVQRHERTGNPNGRIQFRIDAQSAAKRRRHEQSTEFRDVYRWRAGIEATNSQLKRMMGLGRLRVRGKKAVKLSVMLKLAGWNLLRAVDLRARRARGLATAR